jgi:hypothetical protein
MSTGEASSGSREDHVVLSVVVSRVFEARVQRQAQQRRALREL